MKALMYHYVRTGSSDLPWFRYLHIDDFRAQLDHLQENYSFVNKAEFLESLVGGPCPQNKCVLTFDDALSDHYEHVLPELIERGLWGIFYVPTGMYQYRQMLQVHRIHLLIGTHGGRRVLEFLESNVSPEMLGYRHIEAFHKETYQGQDNDAATDAVKRVLNYFISPEWQKPVLDELMGHFFENESDLIDEYYVTADQLREMYRSGMVIGSHSITHPVFSKIDEHAQQQEISGSIEYLESVLEPGSIKTFCYPYGGDHTFTDTTEKLLTEAGIRFSFNVEPRDITKVDLADRPQALPRYDCNRFPHGRASIGTRRAA